MDFRNFRLGIIIRAILLSAVMFSAVYAFQQEEWYVTTIISAILSIAVLINIIQYAEKYKRGLSDFLLSIKSRDFISSSASISDRESKDILKEAYNIIMTELQNTRIDKEVQYHFLKTLIEHVRVALFTFNEKGNIQFINKTASELLGINQNHNISKLKTLNASLYHLIQRLKSGENELLKVKIHDDLLHLSVYATEIKIQNRQIKLISLQNIKQELEYQELESWQKLIRVLTHEIMNSVTPISSLSNAMNESLQHYEGNKAELAKISDDDFEDMISSLKTIETRSKGLLKFVSSYKQLTRIPQPDFKEVNIVELINHCHTLLKKKIMDSNIQFDIKKPDEKIYVHADYDQIEQVVINLLINAIDAVSTQEKPEIFIKIQTQLSNKHKIIISDNGKGIDPEDLDKIFIPFFTTKKEGSGIGLSLSRQIMRLHKGAIRVNSDLDKGTEFILEF